MNERLAYLFRLYYYKQITQEQEQELFEWIDMADPEELDILIKQQWNEGQSNQPYFDEGISKKMLDHILSSESKETYHQNHQRIRKIQPLVWWAASIAFLVTLGGYYFVSNKNKGFSVITENINAQVEDAAPGSNRATLKLGDGTIVLLDDAHIGEVATEGTTSIIKLDDGQLSYQDAVNGSGSATINTIRTPRGGQYRVILPDGTKVWLNAASSISFPAAFPSTERVVEVSGEAYLEISKKPTAPFIVKTGKTVVQVMGTAFNIMNYPEEGFARTALFEGAIKILSEKSSKVMKPGELVIANDNGNLSVLKDINIDAEVAWKDGYFFLDDTDVEKIMNQLARWYDIHIVYSGKIPETKLTGKISRNVNLTAIISILKFSGIDCSFKDGTLTIHTS